MNTVHLVYFFLSALLVAALPGPAMMLVIDGAVHGGWRRGAAVAVGIVAADVLLLAAVCGGLGAALAASPSVLALMNTAAALYLMYLGVLSLYEAKRLSGSLPPTPRRLGMREGFAVTLVNPKTILFLLAYLPQFVQPALAWPPSVQLLVLSALFVAAVAAVMGAYAAAAHSVRHHLHTPTVRRIMAVCFGLLLIYLGAGTLLA